VKAPTYDHRLVIWINGRPSEYITTDEALTLFTQHLYGTRNAGCVSPTNPTLPDWSVHDNGAPNAIRLGEVSDAGFGPGFPRNYSADATFDEFYLWRAETEFAETAEVLQREVVVLRRDAMRLWDAGRYYRPAEDAVFTSGTIRFRSPERRLVPGTGKLPDEHQGVVEISADSPVGGGEGIRLLGVSWTWHAEDYNRRDGSPIVYAWLPRNVPLPPPGKPPEKPPPPPPSGGGCCMSGGGGGGGGG